MKKTLSLLLVLILVLGILASCGNSASSSKKKMSDSYKENALRIAMNTGINTLDPDHKSMAAESRVITLVYDSPMRKDSNDVWQPWVCTKMEPNEDGTVVDCEIRDDVYFASGDKMVIEDIIYSLERSKTATDVLYIGENSYIEKVDETHFKWYFPNEGASFNSLKEFAYDLKIVNKSFCEQYISDPTEDLLFHIDGSGAYRPEGELKAGTDDVVLVKNEKYWGTCSFDKIILKYISGDQQIAFEAGDIDWFEFSREGYDKLVAYSNVAITTKYIGAVNFLVLNCTENSPFVDIKLREALQYSFDREDIGLIACDNAGTVAWTIITPDSANWSDVVPHRTLDADKAKKMMTELGYSESNPCEITLLGIGLEGYMPALEAMKESLDKLYFKCEIKETADVTPYFTGDFDCAIIGVGMGDIFSAFGALFMMDSGMDLAMYDDGGELANRIMQANDPESAKQALLDIDATMAYIALSYPARFYAYDDRLDFGDPVYFDFITAKWKK